MQIAQYSIAASLIYFVIVNYQSCILIIKESHPTQSIEKLKKTMYANNCALWMGDSLRSLPTVDKAAMIMRYSYNGTQVSGIRAFLPRENTKNCLYITDFIEPSLLPILDIKIQETSKPHFETPEDSVMIPVFAKAEDFDSISKKIALPHKVSMQEIQLPDRDRYIRLGYIKPIGPLLVDNFDRIILSYYVISDLDKFSIGPDNIANNKSTPFFESCSCIFTVKNAEKKDKQDIINKIKMLDVDPLLETGCIYYKKYDLYNSAVNMIKIYNMLIVTCLICLILTVYSSIALETRGRQKEVAIRKVNGAKTKDIIKMFSRTYIKTLSISFFLGLIFPIVWNFWITQLHMIKFSSLIPVLVIYCVSFLIIALVTFLTVWQKIYKISHINPALLIKKE